MLSCLSSLNLEIPELPVENGWLGMGSGRQNLRPTESRTELTVTHREKFHAYPCCKSENFWIGFPLTAAIGIGVPRTVTTPAADYQSNREMTREFVSAGL